jgi:hypothetical protein
VRVGRKCESALHAGSESADVVGNGVAVVEDVVVGGVVVVVAIVHVVVGCVDIGDAEVDKLGIGVQQHEALRD